MHPRLMTFGRGVEAELWTRKTLANTFYPLNESESRTLGSNNRYKNYARESAPVGIAKTLKS